MPLFNSKKLKIIFEIIFLCLFVSFIFVDVYKRKTIYDISNDLTIKIQSNKSEILLYFFYLCTLIAQAQVVIIFMVIYFFECADKVNGLVLISSISIFNVFIDYLKSFYHDPRPYFINSEIEKKWHDADFGNPSGHSFIAVYLYFIIQKNTSDYFVNKLSNLRKNTEDYYLITKEKNLNAEKLVIKKKSPINYNFLIKFICFFVYIIIVILVGLSRIALGVHSIDEVISGYIYGQFFLYLYCLYFQKFFSNLLINCTDQKFKGIYKDRINLILVSLYTIFNLISIIIFICFKNFYKVPTQWENILKKKGYTSDSPYYLYNRTFINSGTFSLIFGIALGANNTNESYSISVDFVKKLKFLKRFLRFVILLLLFIGEFAIFSFIPMGDNCYVLFFFKFNIPGFIFGFSLVKILPIIYSKLHIDIEGDYMKINKKNDDLLI